MENYQIQQEIKIDFATPDVPPRVYAKQYDNNMRIIKTNLYANGQPYTVQSGFDVNVRMAKPDGTYVYNPALEISDTYVLIVLTQQMLAVAGECPAEIEVTQGSNVLSTATFVICVAADPVPEHAIESTNEFKTIQELAAEVEAAAKVVTDNLDAINAVSENIEAIKKAPQQAQNAANSATLAQSWAAGGTGTREGEDTDNAKYYAQIAQQVAQGGVGYYETPEALRTAHPTGQAGNWAIVGSTDTIWVWDTDTGDWVDSHGNIDLSNYYTKTEADARFSAISSGVPTVSATKEQYYFDIDLPSTNQFVIVPNAAYATGDTFRIAGRAVAAKLPNGDSLPDAFFAANAKVMCLWADTVLYFVGGGGGTVPNNVMLYRMDDGTPGQQPEQTIWGQTSDGQDAYVHSCTKAVYDSESEKTLDVLLREMLLAELPQPGQWNFAPYRISYGEGGVNAKRHPWVNFDDDLDKTVYAALYAAIGDTMSDGAADGMFNCKKLADRFPLVCGANFEVLSQGGEREHILTGEEMPSHRHYSSAEKKEVMCDYSTSKKWGCEIKNTSGYTAAGGGFTTSYSGGDKAHNNMPPYLTQVAHIHT